MPTLAAVPLILMAASAVTGAIGTIGQGNAQRAQLDNQAAQLDQAAGQTRATAQRQQQDQLRKGAYAVSRAEAVQAAGGADPDSVTSITNETNLTGQSEYGALTALYNGEEKARGQEYEATNDRIAGKAAHRGAVINAIGGLLLPGSKPMAPSTTGSGGESMLSKYAEPYGNDSNIQDSNNPLPWQTLGYKNPDGGYYY